MGAVVWIGCWTRILGGFDYAHVLVVLMGMVIVYYGLLYAFLRMWLRSVLLAAAVLAVAVKIQINPLAGMTATGLADRSILKTHPYATGWTYRYCGVSGSTPAAVKINI